MKKCRAFSAQNRTCCAVSTRTAKAGAQILLFLLFLAVPLCSVSLFSPIGYNGLVQGQAPCGLCHKIVKLNSFDEGATEG